VCLNCNYYAALGADDKFFCGPKKIGGSGDHTRFSSPKPADACFLKAAHPVLIGQGKPSPSHGSGK
jgi:hypothetical protein